MNRMRPKSEREDSYRRIRSRKKTAHYFSLSGTTVLVVDIVESDDDPDPFSATDVVLRIGSVFSLEIGGEFIAEAYAEA